MTEKFDTLTDGVKTRLSKLPKVRDHQDFQISIFGNLEGFKERN
jgi:hypothetical protein